MKVAVVSTYVSNGGAAIAALRLHQGLMKHKDIESAILQKFAEDGDFMSRNNVYLAEKDKSFISKAKRRLALDAESIQNKQLKNKSGHYEMISFATTSYRLDEHPIIKDADIIHLHWVAEFLDYPTFFKNVRQPIVWTLHDMNPFQGIFHYKEDEINNQPIFGTLDRENLNIKIKSIHKKNNINIVSPSQWLTDLSQKSEVFGPYPHYVIANGIDFLKYPLLDKNEVKKKIGVDNGLKTLLFISSNIELKRKGFDILLSALSRLNTSNLNLISIGGEKISVNDKINHIHYKKITDTTLLNELYSAADITLLPSREDNLPNVMVESFANGTPVMSFSNGGMKEHIKNGENGILIEDINPDALAAGINEFLEEKYHFNNDNIRNYAIENFSVNRQTEKYINLYHSILNS